MSRAWKNFLTTFFAVLLALVVCGGLTVFVLHKSHLSQWHKRKAAAAAALDLEERKLSSILKQPLDLSEIDKQKVWVGQSRATLVKVLQEKPGSLTKEESDDLQSHLSLLRISGY